MREWIKREFPEAYCELDEVAFCHDYKVIKTVDDHQLEVCRRCKREDWFHARDNTRYANTHVRAFAQPFGATRAIYERVNGYESIRNFEKLHEEKADRKNRMDAMQQEYEKEMKKAKLE